MRRRRGGERVGGRPADSAVSDPTSRPITASRRSRANDTTSSAAPTTDPISTTQRSHGSQLGVPAEQDERPDAGDHDHRRQDARTIVLPRPRHSSRPEIATTAAMDGASATA